MGGFGAVSGSGISLGVSHRRPLILPTPANTHIHTDAIREAVGGASWSSSSSAAAASAAAPLPVEFTLNLERQQQPSNDGGGGGGRKRQRTGRPKREVLHVLLVLETTTGCRLGADALLEQQDLRGLAAAGAEGPGALALAAERAGRLVGTLEVCLSVGRGGRRDLCLGLPTHLSALYTI